MANADANNIPSGGEWLNPAPEASGAVIHKRMKEMGYIWKCQTCGGYVDSVEIWIHRKTPKAALRFNCHGATDDWELPEHQIYKEVLFEKVMRGAIIDYIFHPDRKGITFVPSALRDGTIYAFITLPALMIKESKELEAKKQESDIRKKKIFEERRKQEEERYNQEREVRKFLQQQQEESRRARINAAIDSKIAEKMMSGIDLKWPSWQILMPEFLDEATPSQKIKVYKKFLDTGMITGDQFRELVASIPPSTPALDLPVNSPITRKPEPKKNPEWNPEPPKRKIRFED